MTLEVVGQAGFGISLDSLSLYQRVLAGGAAPVADGVERMGEDSGTWGEARCATTVCSRCVCRRRAVRHAPLLLRPLQAPRVTTLQRWASACPRR